MSVEVIGFVAVARGCVVLSRAEPGVLRCDLWREAEGERRLVFDELYVDDAAARDHLASDHLKAFGTAARDLVAARPSITVAHPVEVVN